MISFNRGGRFFSGLTLIDVPTIGREIVSIAVGDYFSGLTTEAAFIDALRPVSIAVGDSLVG